MSLALPTSRIRLPDKLKNYKINPKWAKYRPKFVFFPPAGPSNLITGETPTNPGSFPTLSTGLPGKGYYNDATINTSFIYDREAGNGGSNYTVFFVFTAGSGITDPQNLIACGTITGPNKPFNYRFQIDPGVTRGIRYYHDTGPTYVTEDFNSAVVLKAGEPSTVSASLNGTLMHKCLDGSASTATLGTAPASAGEGDLRVMGAAGTNVSIDGTMHLAIVFDEFIPNDIIIDLHKNPADFFIEPANEVGFVATGATTVILTGQESTAGQGTLSATGAANVTLAGQESTAGQGTVTVDIGATLVTLTGQEMTSGQGALVVTGESNVSLAGQEITSGQGTVTATGAANVTLTGQESTAGQGTVTVDIAGSVTVILSGQATTAGQGTLSLVTANTITLTGQSITSGQGTISVAISGTGENLITGLNSLITDSYGSGSIITNSLGLGSTIQ